MLKLMRKSSKQINMFEQSYSSQFTSKKNSKMQPEINTESESLKEPPMKIISKMNTAISDKLLLNIKTNMPVGSGSLR